MGALCVSSKNNQNEANKQKQIDGDQKEEVKVIKGITLKNKLEKGKNLFLLY